MYHPESLVARDANARVLLSADRERVAAALCLHFAADNIGMEMLEDRLDRVYVAQSAAELQSLLADLPPLPDELLDTGNSPLIAPSSAVPMRGVVMAALGGAGRKGSWLVPRELKVFAIMGGVEIDLREAKFAPGITQIDVTAFMGGVEIIVPRGVRVEILGAAIMGGFEADAGDATALDPNQPVLRVTGLAIMAAVEVKVKRPAKGTLRKFEAALLASRRISSQ